MDIANLPLHPMLVHFPIALFITAAGLEAASLIFKKAQWHQAAVIIYVLGALSSPVTAWTGLMEQQKDHLQHPVVFLHRNLALITTGIALLSLPILWFLNRKQEKDFQRVFFVFALIAVIFVSLAAYNGGRLVYEYSIGVEP